MAPSSRFALSLKPNVAYLDLNFCALWKKQMTLPSLGGSARADQYLGALSTGRRDELTPSFLKGM